MRQEEITEWLLKGDMSIQYQVFRDLFGQNRKDLQNRIATEGWGKQFLSKRKAEGHWGKRFYEPKWTSTHYTLLDLRNLCISPNHPLIQESLRKIVETHKAKDGGIQPIGTIQLSDVCINGMFLNYASYFKLAVNDLESLVDCLLNSMMNDGGFNCRWNKSGATHSSLHSTLSVIEGFTEYIKNGYQYRIHEVQQAKQSGIEFILQHQLFLSDRTGKIINKDFLKFPYPPRWRYDILRALDYFQYEGVNWDTRMKPAIDVLLNKRNKNGSWNQYAPYPGKIHFQLERAGQPGRWNTLRALRVFKHLDQLHLK